MSKKPTRRLRELMHEDEPTLMVEALNALTARMVEDAGVPVTYLGGHACGSLNWAVPDHGLVTLPEMAALTHQVTSAVNIPVIADADQGGETSLNVRRTVRMFEQSGAAGIHLEDTVNPKHVYGGRDSLCSVQEMQARIEAAVGARHDDDFVIIARSDELYNGGTLEAAIARGKAYAAAGADVFMCTETSLANIRQIVAEVPIPVLDYNKPVQEWKDTGLGLNMYTGPGLMGAIRAHQSVLAEILTTGSFDFHRAQPEPGLYDRLIGAPEWDQHTSRWMEASDRLRVTR